LSPWLYLFAPSSPYERVAQWLVGDVGRNKESHSDNQRHTWQNNTQQQRKFLDYAYA
jgi:hypothetical protein